jgi:hypothetical protein
MESKEEEMEGEKEREKEKNKENERASEREKERKDVEEVDLFVPVSFRVQVNSSIMNWIFTRDTGLIHGLTIVRRRFRPLQGNCQLKPSN